MAVLQALFDSCVINDMMKLFGLRKMQEICATLELQMVPVEEVGTDLPSKYPTVEALLERADGEYTQMLR